MHVKNKNKKQAQSQIAFTILWYAKIVGLLQRTFKQRILAQKIGVPSQFVKSMRPKPFWQVSAVVGAYIFLSQESSI